jgi:hypothetical protein
MTASSVLGFINNLVPQSTSRSGFFSSERDPEHVRIRTLPFGNFCKITNAPVVFTALILNGFDFFGLKKVSIFRAHPNAPRNDVAPLKTITYRGIKTTGSLIVRHFSVKAYRYPTVLVKICIFGIMILKIFLTIPFQIGIRTK